MQRVLLYNDVRPPVEAPKVILVSEETFIRIKDILKNPAKPDGKAINLDNSVSAINKIMEAQHINLDTRLKENNKPLGIALCEAAFMDEKDVGLLVENEQVMKELLKNNPSYRDWKYQDGDTVFHTLCRKYDETKNPACLSGVFALIKSANQEEQGRILKLAGKDGASVGDLFGAKYQDMLTNEAARQFSHVYEITAVTRKSAIEKLLGVKFATPEKPDVAIASASARGLEQKKELGMNK